VERHGAITNLIPRSLPVGIARFGRFPHRNKILGRASTAEELEFLKTHEGF